MTPPHPEPKAVSPPGEGYARPDAAAAAIRELTARERAVVRLAARSFWRERVRGSRAWTDPDDLLHEAIVRTLQGSRRWRTSVSMAKHLIRSMESISWDVVRARRARPHGFDDAAIEDVEPSDRPGAARAPASSIVEDTVVARDELERLADLFERDAEALQVLRCRAIRLSASETCAHLGMERGRYDTVTKRIRRALTKHTQGERAETRR